MVYSYGSHCRHRWTDTIYKNLHFTPVCDELEIVQDQHTDTAVTLTGSDMMHSCNSRFLGGSVCSHSSSVCETQLRGWFIRFGRVVKVTIY